MHAHLSLVKRLSSCAKPYHEYNKAMQPAELSKLLGSVSAPTLRRWGKTYSRYLSPGASPPRGKPRSITERDARVLSLIASLRDAGHDQNAILARLDAEEANNWENLPPLPNGWDTAGTMPVALAAARAAEMSETSALRTQNQYLQQRFAEVSEQRDRGLERITLLEAELNRLRGDSGERLLEEQQKVTTLQTELQAARSEVSLLEGLLSAYSLGRDKPVNIGVIIAGTLAIGMVLAVLLMAIVAIVLTVTP